MRGGEPTAVLIDIKVFEVLLKRLEELEDRELFSDPKVIARLRKAREDHLAGRVTSRANLVKELGLEGELKTQLHRHVQGYHPRDRQARSDQDLKEARMGGPKRRTGRA